MSPVGHWEAVEVPQLGRFLSGQDCSRPWDRPGQSGVLSSILDFTCWVPGAPPPRLEKQTCRIAECVRRGITLAQSRERPLGPRAGTGNGGQQGVSRQRLWRGAGWAGPAAPRVFFFF